MKYCIQGLGCGMKAVIRQTHCCAQNECHSRSLVTLLIYDILVACVGYVLQVHVAGSLRYTANERKPSANIALVP